MSKLRLHHTFLISEANFVTNFDVTPTKLKLRTSSRRMWSDYASMMLTLAFFGHIFYPFRVLSLPNLAYLGEEVLSFEMSGVDENWLRIGFKNEEVMMLPKVRARAFCPSQLRIFCRLCLNLRLFHTKLRQRNNFFLQEWVTLVSMELFTWRPAAKATAKVSSSIGFYAQL